MSTARLLRYLVRTAMANAQAIAWEQWHEAWLDQVALSPEEVIGLVDTQSAADQVNQAKIVARLPGPEVFTQCEDIIDRLRSVALGMRAEDPHYIAQVRITVYDAMVAMRRGELDDAHRHLVAAHKRLHWVVHERKRDSTHMDRRIKDTVIYDSLVELIAELLTLTTKLGSIRQQVAVA